MDDIKIMAKSSHEFEEMTACCVIRATKDEPAATCLVPSLEPVCIIMSKCDRSVRVFALHAGEEVSLSILPKAGYIWKGDAKFCGGNWEIVTKNDMNAPINARACLERKTEDSCVMTNNCDTAMKVISPLGSSVIMESKSTKRLPQTTFCEPGYTSEPVL